MVNHDIYPLFAIVYNISEKCANIIFCESHLLIFLLVIFLTLGKGTYSLCHIVLGISFDYGICASHNLLKYSSSNNVTRYNLKHTNVVECFCYLTTQDKKGKFQRKQMNSPKEIYQDLNHKDNVIKLSKFDCSRISVIIHCYSRFNERLKDSNLNILPYWSR